jgi:hypothetical protein
MARPWSLSIYNSAPYLQPEISGDEPYLVKINPSLEGAPSLVYSTFLGGGSPDGELSSFGTCIGVDARGTAFVGGETGVPGIEYSFSRYPVEAPPEFPFTEDALLPAFQGGGFDALFMQVSPLGNELSYSTFLGGSGNDRAYGLAIDPAGNVVLTGLTSSSDFPLKNPAQKWPGIPGEQNAFVTKFSFP